MGFYLSMIRVPTSSHTTSYDFLRYTQIMSLENPEQFSQEKQRLLDLESTGEYVFHGSDSDTEEFEPRQAHNFIKGENHPDGDPAIFASSVAEYAIFMALINKTNCPKGYRSGSGTTNGQTTYRATQETLDQLQEDASGWVYVFDKDQFNKRAGWGIEYTSFTNVKPVEKIRVSKLDLPSNISIIEE